MQLVVDTDIGTDDALALMLCLDAEKRGQLKIRGITCVHGNTSLSNVCNNALKLLHSFNRLDIPVYRGCEDAIVETMGRAEEVHGSDGFGDFDYPNPPDIDVHIRKEHAVYFLTEIVKKHPGNITILTLGPLTNIALAMKIDPTFCDNVKEIYTMGGNIAGVGNASVGAEFNFYCDPEAAFIVLKLVKCPMTIIPWETTLNYASIPYEWRRNELGKIESPQVELLNKIEKNMIDNEIFGAWINCDQIAASVMINPRVATAKKERYATIELCGINTKGGMVIDHFNHLKQPSNVLIIESIDIDMYKQMLMKAMCSDH